MTNEPNKSNQRRHHHDFNAPESSLLEQIAYKFLIHAHIFEYITDEWIDFVSV